MSLTDVEGCCSCIVAVGAVTVGLTFGEVAAKDVCVIIACEGVGNEEKGGSAVDGSSSVGVQPPGSVIFSSR